MIRRWFPALARKFLASRGLQPLSRRVRRLGTSLRLETLEDRTLTSTLSMEPLSVTGIATVAYDSVPTISGDRVPMIERAANARAPGGPALDKILQDLQTQASQFANFSPTSYFHFALLFDSTALLRVGDQRLLPPRPWAGSGTTPNQSAPGSFPISSNPDNGVGQPSLPADAGPDKSPSQPGPEPNPVNATGADQGRPASPAATAETHSIPTGPATSLFSAGSGDQASPHLAYLSRNADVIFSLPLQDTELAGSETNDVVLPPAEAGTVESPAARSEIKRLPGDVPDGQLLQRFVRGREEAAFTALVQRYEPLVSRVCQRVLGDVHAAQDALQATFLVLARRAAVLDGQRPLAGWLYQVAYHVALRMRAVAARQRQGEKEAAIGRPLSAVNAPAADIEKQELRQALLDELQRLPEKYRAPLVLCYFDGRTHHEAARAIGLPRGSMAKRIREGLERLRDRLLERGFFL